MARLVERETLNLHAFGIACRRAPPEHRLDARDQLARRERLCQVVVGPGIEAGDLVGLLRARRQHHDRDVARVRIAPQDPDQFEAAHVGQHPVDQDEVGPLVADTRECGLAVLGKRDFAAGAPQPESNQVADRLLILDDQDSGVRHT